MKKIVSTLLAVLLLTACSTSEAQEKPSKASSLNLNKISEELKEVAKNGLNEATEAAKDVSEPSDEQKEENEQEVVENTNNAQNGSNETREPVREQQSSSNTQVQQPQAPVQNEMSYTCGTSSCTEAEFNKYMEEQLLPQYACQSGRDWNKACDYVFVEDYAGYVLYGTEAEARNAGQQSNGGIQSSSVTSIRNNGGNIVGYIAK